MSLSLFACTEANPLDIPLGDGGLDGSANLVEDAASDASFDACDLATWCRDADGDGYGDPADCVEVCWGLTVEGYVFENDGDCYDGNADARPGQTAFFAVDRGDGSFDYDCDGAEELWRPSLAVCASEHAPFEAGWLCVCTLGTPSDCTEWTWCKVPGCGETALWDYQGCSAQLAHEATQRCR